MMAAATSSSATTEVIRVQGLTFKYPTATEPAIRGMDFTVGGGEIFGFLGPSGAGKSTTQKVLIGLLRGHGGEVSVWGKEPRAWGPDYYERIGVSFELPNHYQKLTGLENLRFFASLYRGATADPMRLLDAVGLGDDANKRVGKYSKGMQMRLTFARSLINDPELLFLDEPTSGMDPVNARNVRRMILDLKARGRIVFLTTHDMTTANELCDRVAFVVDGKIVAIDTPAELKIARGQRATCPSPGCSADFSLRTPDKSSAGETKVANFDQVFTTLCRAISAGERDEDREQPRQRQHHGIRERHHDHPPIGKPNQRGKRGGQQKQKRGLSIWCRNARNVGACIDRNRQRVKLSAIYPSALVSLRYFVDIYRRDEHVVADRRKGAVRQVEHRRLRPTRHGKHPLDDGIEQVLLVNHRHDGE